MPCVRASAQNAPERRPVTKFATKRDRQVLQSPRACGPEKTPQAQGFTEGVILRGRRDVSPRQDAMKEVCSLRRGWAGGSASLSSPTRIIVECDSARLDGPLFSGRLIRIPPSATSGSPAPCAGGQVARRLPGRLSSVAASRCAAGLDFLWGAEAREDRHLGALPAGTGWTLWQIGGDCNAIAGA